MSIETVLIVDDEPIMRSFLAKVLTRKNKRVAVLENGKQAIAYLEKNSVDLVITDSKMPHMSGIDLLQFIQRHAPHTLTILMTAYASIENAVEAMQLGAFHYLVKPFSLQAIEAVIKKADLHFSLIEENMFLKEEMNRHLSEHNIIAEDPLMKGIVKKVMKIAKSNASVFISGESGTGKEIIARAIHFLSKRKNAPFVAVNCAAIPDSLIESEFFGHEKGAFTGAIQKRLGRFERAHLGTLFLDEVTETPISIQPKLLRAIQEMEFERVGSNVTIQVDVRLIATTNRNMQEAIQDKIFRKDLYYRLNVVPIHLPPLRERKKDIYPLAMHFIYKHCKQHGKKEKILSQSAQKKLLEYDWPGNVRELANVIERAIVLEENICIEPEVLFVNPLEKNTTLEKAYTGKTLKELEKEWILQSLEKHRHNKTKTAHALGITVRTLRNKLKEYGQISPQSAHND